MIINKILDEFKRLIAIDSPVGLYEPIEKYIIDRLTAMNVAYYKMNKGGVIAEINVDTSHLKKDPIYVMGHCDTLGLQIRYINEDGTLSVVPLGYLPEHCIIGENVRIYTIDDEIFTGTVQLKYSSEHLRPMDLREKYPHYDDDIIVVIDEDCKCSNDVAKLGINVGDWIAIEPRPIITENGYIKSRFLDDKINVAIMLVLISELVANKSKLTRNILFGFTMHEEVGNGGSWIPPEVSEIMSLDVACIGPRNMSDEKKVTILAKETRFSYNRMLIKSLVNVAKMANIDYVVDVFTPDYGTDCEDSLIAGYDVKHATIGPGTLATHNYERTHIDALINTYRLLKEYLLCDANLE